MTKEELKNELLLLDNLISEAVEKRDYALADRLSFDWSEIKIKLKNA